MREQAPDQVRLIVGGNTATTLYAEDYAPRNPFETPAEAEKWLEGHDKDILYQYVDSDGAGMISRRTASYAAWAMGKARAQVLAGYLLRYDPTRCPSYIEEHLVDVAHRIPTEALVSWIEAYPKSTYHTRRPPVLPHRLAGGTRSQLAAEIVRFVLPRRGIPVRQYTRPEYSSCIRGAAYLALGLPYRSCRQEEQSLA